MALNPGARLGPYEILSSVGAGGMGEVYRARDTRLDRTVAVKVLPSHVSGDPAVRERFEREARTVAALNHPHICTVHDVGHQDGIDFLVLEYLEGETLADHLAKSRMLVEEALAIAIQITDALDKAHRARIVHRDLKPGNIMLVRRRGHSGPPDAKLLDFGLAKITPAVVAASGLSAAPTVQTPVTMQGTILGTLQYMAPEQIEGDEADARTDIFAFGAVLHEMLTGQKAFEGKSQASLIGAILHVDPRPTSTLQPLVSPALDRCIKKCLAKDPDRRWQSAGDLHDELLWIAEADARAERSTPILKQRGRERLPWVVAAACLTVLIAVVVLARAGYFTQRPPDALTYRSTYTLPDGLRFAPPPTPGPSGRFALSPDGRRIAFVAMDVQGRVQLWVRVLETFAAEALAGTDDASYPFWSPDSRSIAFVAQNTLKTISVAGGPPVTISETAAAGRGTWNADGVILFSAVPGSLNRVPASGTSSAPATVFDAGHGEPAHSVPFFLPDGQHFFYTAGNMLANPAGVYVASLDSQDRSLLLPGAVGAMYAQGYVLFLRGTTLMAQPFDAHRRQLTGDAVQVAEGIDTGGLANPGAYSVSGTGVLAYQTRGDVRSQLTWVDRSGRPLGVLSDAADQISLDLSPDGARAAVSLLDPARNTRDLWIYDVVRGFGTKFTSDPADEHHPVWSPDGKYLAYGSTQKGSLDVRRRASSGAGPEETLLEHPGNEYLTSWSPDGRFLMYFNGVGGSPQTMQDVWVLPAIGPHTPTPFVQTEVTEVNPQFSPDGRWVAYASDESGRQEIYVTPFPGPGRKWPVSPASGSWPRWRGDGKELFYLSQDGKLTAAEVDGQGAAFTVGAVRALFEARARTAPYRGFSPGYAYDVASDGQRFLINMVVGQTTAMPPLTLVVNWTAGLTK